MIQSFLLNPFEYHKFDTMKEISLHIFSFKYGPFFDEAIKFAEKWRGNFHFMGTKSYGRRKAH